jgi:hypothetical protein
LSILAALVFALMGSVRFRHLMSRAQKLVARYPNFSRIGGVFAALFGVFLVYAYL